MTALGALVSDVCDLVTGRFDASALDFFNLAIFLGLGDIRRFLAI